MKTILEEQKELRILADYDVVVVGGGIAGAAAALAAARVKGTKVCLLERYCGLGGLATLGNVVCYLPLCDGNGRQVISGISEEFARLAVADDPEDNEFLKIRHVPACWDDPKGSIEERKKHRLETWFNPITFAYLLERLLLKNRVKLYYDSRFSTVIKQGDVIKAVVFESKSGRCAITCRAVVDCTGSADVCFEAGEKTANNLKNSRCGWYYYTDGKSPTKLAVCSDDFNNIFFHGNSRHLPVYREDRVESVTDQVLDSRQFMMDHLAALSQKEKTHYQVIHGVSMPTFRLGRRLVGKVTLRESDDHRWFEDSLGMTGDWRKPGPIICLPLRCMAAVKTRNLITAGRCISAAGDTWDLTRVIPTCGITGEAAGVAAAAFAKDSSVDSILNLDVRSLQKYMLRHHNIIDKSLLK